MVMSVGSSTVGAIGRGAGDSSSAIAALQKRQLELMKKLQEASKDTSKGAKERLELLQVEIQAVQMQIQLLVAAAAEKAALAQLGDQQKSAAGAAQPEKARSNSSSIVDTTA